MEVGHLSEKLPQNPCSGRLSPNNNPKNWKEPQPMKRLLAGITASVLLAAPALQAQELTETLPMAYVNLPLGGADKAQSLPVYGLRMSQASVGTAGSLSLFGDERPALMDFQMKDGQPHAFTVNGLNTLSKQTVVYADGTSGTETNIH